MSCETVLILIISVIPLSFSAQALKGPIKRTKLSIFTPKYFNMGHSDKTRQIIIEQAAPIYNEKGIAGTTVDDVLNSAGVSRGCLYNIFENKDALSYATVDFLLEKNGKKIHEVMGREKTAKSKIYAYFNHSKTPLNHYMQGGCPIFNMAIEADDNNPVVKEKVKNVMVSGHQFFANIIQKGINDGEFLETLNAEEFAFKMFAAIEGGTVLSRTMGSNHPMLSIIKSLKSELKTFETK